MAAKVAEDRSRRAYAGQSVRLLDVPADTDRGFGVFDHAGGSDPGKLAEAIQQAALTSYGTARPAFVRYLVHDGFEEVAPLIKDMIAEFQVKHLEAEADGQVRRAAKRLALIGAAGELARDWGIVPWETGAAMNAAACALSDWIAGRGGLEPAEVREAIAQVRRFFSAHGDARFEVIDHHAGEPRPVNNRVGWRKDTGDERLWFVLPELWKSEV